MYHSENALQAPTDYCTAKQLYPENRTKSIINTLYGQNSKYLNVKAGGTDSDN
jgi:hypothetical protein